MSREENIYEPFTSISKLLPYFSYVDIKYKDNLFYKRGTLSVYSDQINFSVSALGVSKINLVKVLEKKAITRIKLWKKYFKLAA